jgi:hypothetical protein
MAGAANAALTPDAHARHLQPGFQALFGLAFAEARLTRHDYDAVVHELGTYFGNSAAVIRHLQRDAKMPGQYGDHRPSAPLRRHSQQLAEVRNDKEVTRLAQSKLPDEGGYYNPYGDSQRNDGSWSSGW